MAEDAQEHPPFTIRPAIPRDARSFLALSRTDAAEGRFVRTDAPNLDGGQHRLAFRTVVASERARFLALEGDRGIGDVGVECDAYPVACRVATIGMMAAPDRRGRGVGSALMRAAIDWCGRTGVEKMELLYPDSEAARALYAKSGFRREGRLTGRSRKAIGDRDEIVMGSWLSGGPP